jgi:hypothetical protein
MNRNPATTPAARRTKLAQGRVASPAPSPRSPAGEQGEHSHPSHHPSALDHHSPNTSSLGGAKGEEATGSKRPVRPSTPDTRPLSRHNRVETHRFKSFTYDELLKRDKLNLDIFWLKDEALEESANLPASEIVAQEISDDLEAALEQFATIAEDLK